MVSKTNSNKARLKRHGRIRNHISGTAQRPRLNVFRSLKNIYAQIIDDEKGVTLVLNLGYSHNVEMVAPAGVTIEVPNPNSIIISGADNQVVGQFAAEVREKRPPEPYKGKGIKYIDERIIRKEGKAGKK